MNPLEKAWVVLKVDYGVRQSRDVGDNTHRWDINTDASDELWDEEFETTPVEYILRDAANQCYKAGFGNTGFDPENPEQILVNLRFWANIGSDNFHPKDPDIPVAKRILYETEKRIAEATQGMGGQ